MREKPDRETGRLRATKSFGFRGFPRENILWSIATLNQRGSRDLGERGASKRGEIELFQLIRLNWRREPDTAAIACAFDATHSLCLPSLRPFHAIFDLSFEFTRTIPKAKYRANFIAGPLAFALRHVHIRPCSWLFDFLTFHGRSLSSSNALPRIVRFFRTAERERG